MFKSLFFGAAIFCGTSLSFAGDTVFVISGSVVDSSGPGFSDAVLNGLQVGDTVSARLCLDGPPTLSFSGGLVFPASGLGSSVVAPGGVVNGTMAGGGTSLFEDGSIDRVSADVDINANLEVIFGLIDFSAALLPTDDVTTLGGRTFPVSASIINNNFFLRDGASAVAMRATSISFESDSVGTAFCQATPNSTGRIGQISAFGSTVVAMNDLSLQVSSLPANAFVLFLAAPQQGFIPNPGSSAGNLCLNGPPILRFDRPGQIRNTGVNGATQLDLDFGALPLSTLAGSIGPGSTLNFQAWHRDVTPGGLPSSNFTNGVSVTFN